MAVTLPKSDLRAQVIAAAVFARMLPAMRVLVRPVYARKGIISQEVATGLETAAEVSSPP